MTAQSISMHKGFAFVQFTNPFDARSACVGEDARTVLGQTLAGPVLFFGDRIHTMFYSKLIWFVENPCSEKSCLASLLLTSILSLYYYEGHTSINRHCHSDIRIDNLFLVGKYLGSELRD
ncbi:heterogeneous nuclear ribonucleoprotein C-like 3 isoform X2 [Aphis craccivora]|uniref:Heterogeneous nuclear ribonucleoprotein C-like 3 isoform X2 n=1 Tax=Aphis craccivora TaxID=307492 RepID=A0A6G0ZND9_APHCR|nr:heterogeneous nuclear ribonucleoprotein C-like 3 isoform X2 [Aphis craccivora]